MENKNYCPECGRKLKEVIDDNKNDLRLYEMQMRNGIIDMTFGSEQCDAFVYSILQIFKQNGGKNFVSTTIEVPGKELGGRYALTIQKVGALTPIEKVRKDTAKEVLDKVEEKLWDRRRGKNGRMINYGDITTLELDEIRKEYGVEVDDE